MKIGLLICDHVNPAYQEKFGDYPDMFKSLFPEFEWHLFDVVNGDFPKYVDECEIYFATGSLHSVYEPLAWIQQLKHFIAQLYKANKYFIGFCFGHQLIGEALGGKVKKSPNGWSVGVLPFDIKEKKSWMTPPQDPLNLLMMCQDQILELPPNSTILAGNEQCPVGMIQVGQRFLGIQGHPEFTKAYDRFLIEKRSEKIGQTVVDQAIDSLNLQVHQATIRNWVLNFIHEGN